MEGLCFTPHPNAVFLSKGSPMAQSPSRRTETLGFLVLGLGMEDMEHMKDVKDVADK